MYFIYVVELLIAPYNPPINPHKLHTVIASVSSFPINFSELFYLSIWYLYHISISVGCYFAIVVRQLWSFYWLLFLVLLISLFIGWEVIVVMFLRLGTLIGGFRFIWLSWGWLLSIFLADSPGYPSRLLSIGFLTIASHFSS